MKTKHWIVFVILGIIWSSSFLWIKLGVQESGPTVLVAFRMLFGFLSAAAIAVYQKDQWPRDWKTWGIYAILGPASLAIPIFLISWGEQTIDSAVASILNATVPLFTLIIAHFTLHDDKMTPQKIIGLLIGFAGIVILLSKDLVTSAHNSVIGQAAVLLAALFYAVSGVATRRFTQHVQGAVRGAAPLLTATIFMWALIPFTEPSFKVPVQPVTWIAILWLGVLGSGLAMVMHYYLLHIIGPTRSSLVTYILPPGGVLLGVVFLREQLTWQLLLGAALTIVSLVFANWKPKQ